MEDTEQQGPGIENGSKWSNGTVHFDLTGPTEKCGPPRKVDWFFQNFFGCTEPMYSLLDRNFRKFWLNGSRSAALTNFSSPWLLPKLPPTCPLRLCQVKLSLGTGYKQRLNITLACHRKAEWLHRYSLLALSDSHPPLVSATRPLSVVFEMEAPPSKCTTWPCTSSKATELFPDDPKLHK